MKEGFEEVKREIKVKFAYWNNIKSRKLKLVLILLFLSLIALKIFTTVLTFDWLVNLFN